MTDSEKVTFRMSNRMIQTQYIRSIIYTHGLGVVGLVVVGFVVVGEGEGDGYGSKIGQKINAHEP